MKLYANGVLKGSNNTPIVLSRYQFGDTESESPIAVVDEIVVYNRALSASEIASHFSSVPEPETWTLLMCCSVLSFLRRMRPSGEAHH